MTACGEKTPPTVSTFVEREPPGSLVVPAVPLYPPRPIVYSDRNAALWTDEVLARAEYNTCRFNALREWALNRVDKEGKPVVRECQLKSRPEGPPKVG
jgi:hypothetical protein